MSERKAARPLRDELADLLDIPLDLLTGETDEELIAQAKAINAYRYEHSQPEKSNAEKFADCIRALDNKPALFSGIAPESNLPPNTPEQVPDGEPTLPPHIPSTAEQFADYVSKNWW